MKIKTPRKLIKNRDDKIIQLCKWKNVLHIGACDSPFTKEKLADPRNPLLYILIDEVCNSQIWIDLDKDSIDYLNNNYKSNRSKLEHVNMDEFHESMYHNIDVIVFWEVIEHLMNLQVAIGNIKKVMNENTIIIVSTPNILNILNFVKNLFGIEWFHDDHKIWFSYWLLKNILDYNWIVEEDFYYTCLPWDIHKSTLKWKIKYTIVHMISRFFPQFYLTLLFIWKLK